MTGAAKRSGALSAIAVGLMIYGFSACGCGAAGVLGSILQQQQFEQMRSMQASMNSNGSIQFVDQMTEQVARWQLPSAVVQVIGMGVSIALFVLGVMVFQRKPGAAAWGPNLLWGSIVWGIAEASFSLYVQYDVMQLLPEMAAGDPMAGQAFDSILGMGLTVSICFALGWALIKGACFAWAALHLRKPQVAAQFQTSTPAAYSPRGD
ncbi:MAG: hypothetical protein AAGE52_26795 [Myxococcota bacterium]